MLSIKVRSHWSRVGPKSNISLLVRRENQGHIHTGRKCPCDDGDRSWSDGSYKPRKIKVFLQQPKLTEARKDSLLQDSEGW